MSKSKSKSKSKSATFPDQYWKPNFEIYIYYSGFFEHGNELLNVAIENPPQDGDLIQGEIDGLLVKQKQLAEDFNMREQRREEIEWEVDHLSHHYQSALLTGPEAYPKTWQLMNTMSDLALVPVMHFKKRFARARPSQIDPRVEPLIEVPGHPAFPSGHATQNFLVAHLLSEVIGDDAELIARVFAIARRVAENREWAGVHYPSDTAAGEALARAIFPVMKRVFKQPIQDAIAEWQELRPEPDRPLAAQPQLVSYQLDEASAGAGGGEDPFPGTHFREQQWHLENHGLRGGRPGIDINVRGAWHLLDIWRAGAAPKQPAVRVALIDLAVDLEHPALVHRLDHDQARNLDYPSLPRSLAEGSAAQRREHATADAAARAAYYLEAFASLSSAHAIACAGVIAADATSVRRRLPNGQQDEEEPGCLGIAPRCRIVPYRAMTLTEPVLQKRQILARAVLEAAAGMSFAKVAGAARNGRPAGRWTVAASQPRADVLLLPLPLEPLLHGGPDPLALALAFAATRMPVIIPSGNKGTSTLSYPAEPGRHLHDPASIDDLVRLLDLDRDGVRAIFGAAGKSDDQIVRDLIFSLHDGAAVICVGACNDQGRRSRYSQYGEGLTLVAPSDDVLPPHVDGGGAGPRPQSIATTDLAGIGGYRQDRSYYTLADNEFGFGGTSAAAAQVAGVVALMLEANPRLSAKEVREILCATARVKREQPGDLLLTDDDAMPAQPSAEFGYGLVDATAAVEEAQRRARPGSAS